MKKAILITAILLACKLAISQFTYRGRVFSQIRQQPIGFGIVRSPSPQGTHRNGKELAKIDSLGFFTFTLNDTANVRIVIDCALSGKTMQRVFHSDSVTKIYIKTDCYAYEYNIAQAKKDIENNDIHLLCWLGYAAYYFTSTDSAFEKKYGVKYQTMGDVPGWSDCVWLYNKTVAEYLDKKFGDAWRREVRWDVEL